MIVFLMPHNIRGQTHAVTAGKSVVIEHFDEEKTIDDKKFFTYYFYGTEAKSDQTIQNYFDYSSTGAFVNSNKWNKDNFYYERRLSTLGTDSSWSLGSSNIGGAVGQLNNTVTFENNGWLIAGGNGALVVRPIASIESQTDLTNTKFAFYIDGESVYDTGFICETSMAIDDADTWYSFGADSYFGLEYLTSCAKNNAKRYIKAVYSTPALQFMTTDLTAPTLDSTSQDANIITLNLSDASAGVNSVVVTNSAGDAINCDITFDNNTKSAIATFDAGTEPDTFDIVVTDNVGNEANFDYAYYYEVQIYNYFNDTEQSELVDDSQHFAPAANNRIIDFSNITLLDNGYSLYRIRVVGKDEEEYYIEYADTVQLMVDADMQIYFEYRKEISATIVSTLDGVVLTNDYQAPYTVEYYDMQDNLLDNLDGVKYYVAKYAISTEKYYANGQFVVVDYTANITVPTLTYSDIGYDLADYVLLDDVYNLATIYLYQGETLITSQDYEKCLDAGIYNYEIILKDAYVMGSEVVQNKYAGTFTVLPKNIVMSFENIIRDYDAQIYTFDPNIDDYQYTIVYQQNGQDATIKNVGVYDVIISLTENNYCGTYSLTVTVKQKSLTITPDAQSTYYGDDLAQLTYQALGLCDADQDNLSVAMSSTVDTNSIVGEYVINADIADSSADIFTNYNIIVNNATYLITQRPISVNVLTASKTYGDADPTFEYTIVKGSVVNDDDLGISIFRSNTDENAGTYQNALTMDEALFNANYLVTYKKANFIITPKLAIIKISSAEKVFGQADPVLDYTCSIAEVDITLTRAVGENVGKYKITLDSNLNTNYEAVAISGYLQIKPLEITVSIANQDKVYGQADPSFSLVGDLTAQDLGITFARTAGENVGEYDISIQSVANKNYKIVDFTKGILTIVPAPVTVTALDCSQVYGSADVDFGWSADISLDATQFTGALGRVAGKDVGQYAITLGTLSSQNYSINFVGATLTITPAPLFVSIASQHKTYGNADPQFVYSVGDTQYDDAVAVMLTRQEGEDAGEYMITASIDDANYVLHTTSATLTIKKAKVVITANGDSILFDGEEHTIIPSVNVDVLLNTQIYLNNEVVDTVKNVGEYRFVFAFEDTDNYVGCTAEAVLTINKASCSINILRDNFVYTGAILEPEIECTLPHKIIFDDPDTAMQVGKHKYTLQICDTEGNVNPNYNEYVGYITIIAVPQSQVNGGSVSFADGDIDGENVEVSLAEIKNSEEYNISGMSISKLYSLTYNQSSNATMSVALDYVADDYSNIYVYVYDENNVAKLLSYQVVDGKIMFNVDMLGMSGNSLYLGVGEDNINNIKFAIVKKTAGISIVTLGALVLLAGVISLITVSNMKKHKKKQILKIS